MLFYLQKSEYSLIATMPSFQSLQVSIIHKDLEEEKKVK